MLSKDDFNIVGRLLGILYKGEIVFDQYSRGGTNIDHFADFAIHDYYDKNGLPT